MWIHSASFSVFLLYYSHIICNDVMTPLQKYKKKKMIFQSAGQVCPQRGSRNNSWRVINIVANTLAGGHRFIFKVDKHKIGTWKCSDKSRQSVLYWPNHSLSADWPKICGLKYAVSILYTPHSVVANSKLLCCLLSAAQCHSHKGAGLTELLQSSIQ